MPIIVPRKKAVVTQPYQAMPPRSSSMSGRIVITASDSKATSVTTDTRPTFRARRPSVRSQIAPAIPRHGTTSSVLEVKVGARLRWALVQVLRTT